MSAVKVLLCLQNWCFVNLVSRHLQLAENICPVICPNYFAVANIYSSISQCPCLTFNLDGQIIISDAS